MNDNTKNYCDINDMETRIKYYEEKYKRKGVTKPLGFENIQNYAILTHMMKLWIENNKK